MEVLVLLFFLTLNQVFMFEVYPLFLGGFILCIGVLMAGLMSIGVSPLLGFCFFMILVGGILVVFAYTISLVPREKKEAGESVSKKVSICWFGSLSLLLFMLSVVVYSWEDFVFSDIFYFSSEWAVLVVLWSILFLFIMITVVTVAGKRSGALVKE